MFTLHNGDCLEYLRNMQPGTVDCIVTDPPYGEGAGPECTDGIIGKFSNILQIALFEFYRVSKDNGALYFFTSEKYMADWITRVSPFYKMKNFLIWDKERHSGTYGEYSWQFCWEGIFYGLKGPRKINKYMPNVLRSDEKLKYPMQKPVSILRQMIEASTNEGDLVVDPFMGTGSTGVACVQLGRRFIGCEMNAKKFSIAESRIKSAVFMPSLLTPSNNRLHMDAGDSPRLPSQSTLEGFTPAEQGTTPAPRQ